MENYRSTNVSDWQLYEISDVDTARTVVQVLDGAVRDTLAEAAWLARWIYGSLFTLNMAGSAACFAIEIGPIYKLTAAGLMLIGFAVILCGGIIKARKAIASGRELARTMLYWLAVIEGHARDKTHELRLEQAIFLASERQRLGLMFVLVSSISFLSGLVAIAFGIAAR
jgi:hypothetical protein